MSIEEDDDFGFEDALLAARDIFVTLARYHHTPPQLCSVLICACCVFMTTHGMPLQVFVQALEDFNETVFTLDIADKDNADLQ